MNFLRFKDLKQRNIVRNWTTLTRLIREQGFPAGTRVGAQARAWGEAEVEAWLESRRVAAPARHTEAASQ
jgi:predicted DNA-binding transcriptional regulator AlpA